MRDKIAAVISFAVVLPLLPATATTGKREIGAPVAGQLLQRTQGVGHEHLRQHAGRRAFDQRADGALRGGRLHECRAVEVRTAQRHEQRARLQGAAVGGDAAERTVFADQFAADRLRAASLKVRFMPPPPKRAALRCGR